jgi:NADH-quinone oxidoreductase subunit L
MVMSVGLAAPNAAMFHLFTHAFFKALLFLGAGAVIHALHHEQDIWKMGGLRKTMPKTFFCFALGTLALMGCPFFSGFFSKDSILLAAYHRNAWLFVGALFTAFLTAFYMTRLVVVAFLGRPRSHAAEHGHDGPPAMTTPLIVLAVLAVIAGYPPIAEFVFGEPFIHKLHEIPHSSMVPILAFAVFFIGVIVAWVIYGNIPAEPLRGLLMRPLRDKFYFDEFYAALIAGTQDLLAKLSAWFDKWIIDGLVVRGASGAVWGFGFALRFFQFGNLQGYAFLFGAGVVALLYYVVFTK